jgi:hypothetical protein
MSNQPMAGASHPADSHGGLRLLALAAVAVGVILLAAAAFVLSYSGIHAVALSAGVSPRLARLYPLIFDAMLVVACSAVLALRTAGLPSRCYAWLSLLALLAAVAAADALNATGTKLPHRPTAAVIAVIPWALVLIGFGLLLAMLRHARKRRTTATAGQSPSAVEPAGHVQMRTGIDDLLGPRPAGQAAAERAAGPAPSPDVPADLAIDLEPGHDDPVSDEPAEPLPAAQLPAAPLPAARVARIPRARQETPGNHSVGPSSAPPLSPAPTPLAPADYSRPGRDTGAREPATAEPAADAAPAPRPEPTPDAAPGPGAAAADQGPATPDPAPAATDPEPVAAEREAVGAATPDGEAKPDDEAALDGEAAGDGEFGATPEASGAAAEADGADVAASDSDVAASDGAAEADDAAGAEPGREAEPPATAGRVEPPLLQFDRMRSSPVPPGT